MAFNREFSSTFTRTYNKQHKRTGKLFDNEPYAREFAAKCISAEKKGSVLEVVLDRTLFFPEEGGQSCDKGTLGGHTVTHVSSDISLGFDTPVICNRSFSGIGVLARTDWT